MVQHFEIPFLSCIEGKERGQVFGMHGVWEGFLGNVVYKRETRSILDIIYGVPMHFVYGRLYPPRNPICFPFKLQVAKRII